MTGAGRNWLKDTTHARKRAEANAHPDYNEEGGKIWGGQLGSLPGTGCGLLEAAKVSGFQIPSGCPRPTCLRPLFPNLGDQGDNLRECVLDTKQRLWFGTKKSGGGERICRSAGGVASCPASLRLISLGREPPRLARTGTAAWSVWEREEKESTCRDGGGRCLGAASVAVAAAAPDAAAAAARAPDPRPPTPRARAAAPAGEPPAASARSVVLGAFTGVEPRGRGLGEGVSPGEGGDSGERNGSAREEELCVSWGGAGAGVQNGE